MQGKPSLHEKHGLVPSLMLAPEGGSGALNQPLCSRPSVVQFPATYSPWLCPVASFNPVPTWHQQHVWSFDKTQFRMTSRLTLSPTFFSACEVMSHQQPSYLSQLWSFIWNGFTDSRKSKQTVDSRSRSSWSWANITHIFTTGNWIKGFP